MSFRTIIVILLMFRVPAFLSQESYSEYQIEPVGGKLQFNQVLESQLQIPDIILTKDFSADIKVNFSLDSAGAPGGVVMDGTINNLLRNEPRRIMGFYRFHKIGLPLSSPQPYYVVFNLSTAKYRKYMKQRSRAKIKPPPACDSSCAIVTRADRSPVYYKNEDAGLAEYILEEITYPPVAVERSIEGTVILEFIVETNGFVTGIEAKKLVGAGCTEEAIRLISETRWQPAILNGKAVRYRMNYPITFSLRNSGQAELAPVMSVGN